MQVQFKKATRHLDPADIITSGFPPAGSFEPAVFLNRFFETLTIQQQTQGRAIEGGFVFGGVFADMQADRKPKDYDLYIASPQMVGAVRAYLETGHRGGFDDAENEGEWALDVLGGRFPVTPHEEVYKLFNSDMLGDYFEFSGAAIIDGSYRKLDIKIGTQNIDVSEFLPFCSAPIMAAGMTLGSGEPRYAYHRDFADHAAHNILCTSRPDHPHLVEKAKRKGLTICTPEQLAAHAPAGAGSAPVMSAAAAYQRHIG